MTIWRYVNVIVIIIFLPSVYIIPRGLGKKQYKMGTMLSPCSQRLIIIIIIIIYLHTLSRLTVQNIRDVAHIFVVIALLHGMNSLTD